MCLQTEVDIKIGVVRFFYNRLSFPMIILTALPYTCFILNLSSLNTGDQTQAISPVSNNALYPSLPEISPQKNLWTLAVIIVTTHLGSSYFLRLLPSSAADKLPSLLTAASSAVQLCASDFVHSSFCSTPDTSTIRVAYLFLICCDSL